MDQGSRPPSPYRGGRPRRPAVSASRLAVFVVAVALPACASSERVSPQSLGARGGPVSARLVPLHGEPVTIVGPVVSGDSVVGHVDAQRAAYALADVSHLVVTGLDAGRTAEGVGGGAALAVVVGTAVVVASFLVDVMTAAVRL